MPYHNIEKNLAIDNGTYIVQVMTLHGYVREAKALWEKQNGFNLIASALKPNEFIKAWWQF